MSSDSSHSNKAASESGATPSGGRIPDVPLNKSLGKYELKRSLGAGGMGNVYLAFDTEAKREVALKVLPRSRAMNPVLVRRFKSEAQAASQLNHENIVRVFEAGEAEGYLYIALEYVEGTDLHQLVAYRSVLPVRRSIEIVKQMALALDHAFQKGIVHRDIKPANLLITRDGTVKLTDMGLARSIDESAESGLTRAGTTVGTVDYMAPEQARNSKAADVRSDIYSLGCTWYQMLTADPPFPKGSLTNKLFAHISSPRPDPRKKNESVPQSVVDVMHRMMARRPKDRYQTPLDLLDALNDLEKVLGVSQPRRETQVEDTVSRDTLDDIPAAETPPTIRVPRRLGRAHSSHAVVKTPQTGSNLTLTHVLWICGVVAAVLLAWLVVHFVMQSDDADSKEPKVVVVPGDVDAKPADPKAELDQKPVQVPGEGEQKGTIAQPPGETDKSQTTDSGTGRPKPAANPRDGARIPAWVAQFRDWEAGDGSSAANSATVLTVGRAAGRGSKFSDLTTALRALPKSGGVIWLVGDGPFVIKPFTLSEGSRVAIIATKGDRPVVLFAPEAGVHPDAVLRVSNGSLLLAGLHMLVLSAQYDPSRPLALVDVDSSDLVVRRCSVTLEDNRDSRRESLGAEMTAFRISAGSADAKAPSPKRSRILLDDSIVRGNGISAMTVNRTAVDVVAYNCLFATGDAPIIRVRRGSSASGSSASKTSPGRLPSSLMSSSRQFRFVRCSASTRRTAFEFVDRGPEGDTPLTQVFCDDSVFHAGGSGGPTVLLSLPKWPVDAVRFGSHFSIRKLTWTSKSTHYLGWRSLIKSGSQPRWKVEDGSSWRRAWKDKNSTEKFEGDFWPPFAEIPLSQIAPAHFETTKGAANAATGGNRPGCRVVALAVPRPEMLQRAEALSYRPQLPARLTRRRANAHPVRVDLDNDDLGSVISTTNWPSDTTFLVSGSKTYLSNPIRVRDKSLTIRFVKNKGSSFVVRPRNSRSRSTGVASKAFIYVQNGNLKLENANFEILSRVDRSGYRWFLHVDNGSFSLQNTRVQATLAKARRSGGLIRWTRTHLGGIGIKPPGLYDNYGHISGCLLVSEREVVAGQFRGCGLTVRNSLLVSLETAFSIDLFDPDTLVPSALDIVNTTISASRRVFEIKTAALSELEKAPLRIITEKTIFAPPLTTTPDKKAGPVLLTCEANVLQRRQVRWWGSRNGFSGGTARYFNNRATPAADKQGFQQAWVERWEPGQVLYPLSGNANVSVTGKLSPLASFKPADFLLDPTTRAAGWDVDGSAIGADIRKLPGGK